MSVPGNANKFTTGQTIGLVMISIPVVRHFMSGPASNTSVLIYRTALLAVGLGLLVAPYVIAKLNEK